jgi:DEAD/DEAH box helicase domain-containing protein
VRSKAPGFHMANHARARFCARATNPGSMKNLSFDFSGGGNNDVLVLDVETQFLTEEIPGGWDAIDRLKVAVVVTWDSAHGARSWYEEDMPALLAEIDKYRWIVTFNGERFDFQVLSAYGPVKHLLPKSIDLLALLADRLGFRVKLDSVALATLGRSKTGSGTESVLWWRSGDPKQRQKVVDYCKTDVELTRDIYLFGKENGFVSIDDRKRGGLRRVEISW